jgi:type VI protein secretion system component Hcp
MPELFVRFGEGAAGLPGNAQEPHHLGWFEADSLSFPSFQPETRRAPRASAAGRKTHLQLGMPFNASSCKLYAAASGNRTFAQAEIEVFNSAQQRAFLRYKLKNAVVSDCHPLPDHLLVDISYEAMEVQYLGADGQAAPKPGYDLKVSTRT